MQMQVVREDVNNVKMFFSQINDININLNAVI